MPRTSHHGPLDVYMNSRLVGQLRREPSGAISFQYHPTWLKWEFSLPISLSLPPREQPYVGAPVLAVFDNLLPDNNAIRRRVAERTHAEGTDAYSLLAAIGRDSQAWIPNKPCGNSSVWRRLSEPSPTTKCGRSRRDISSRQESEPASESRRCSRSWTGCGAKPWQRSTRSFRTCRGNFPIR